MYDDFLGKMCGHGRCSKQSVVINSVQLYWTRYDIVLTLSMQSLIIAHHTIIMVCNGVHVIIISSIILTDGNYSVKIIM